MVNPHISAGMKLGPSLTSKEVEVGGSKTCPETDRTEPDLGRSRWGWVKAEPLLQELWRKDCPREGHAWPRVPSPLLPLLGSGKEPCLGL